MSFANYESLQDLSQEAYKIDQINTDKQIRYNLTVIKDPMSVAATHIKTPTAMINFLECLSPKYPNRGAKSM